MGSREFAGGRRVVARLRHSCDLLAEIATLADSHGIAMADLRAIGALQRARLSFYDQTTHRYEEFAVDEPVELVSLLGTVSRRDGETAVHAHVALAGHRGGCIGGHLAPGCVVFACELVMQELIGEPLERRHDEQTGLPLWADL
jgi:uncharacterized protein